MMAAENGPGLFSVDFGVTGYILPLRVDGQKFILLHTSTWKQHNAADRESAVPKSATCQPVNAL